MGNILSVAQSRVNSNMADNDSTENDNHSQSGEVKNEQVKHDYSVDSETSNEERKVLREEAMSEFKKELSKKREQRKEILSRHRVEKEQLKQTLAKETIAKLEMMQKNNSLRELLEANQIQIPEELNAKTSDDELLSTVIEMREEIDKIKKSNNKLRRDLVESNSALQRAYSDIADLHSQNRESMKQINALKEVVTISKSLLGLREQHLNELKDKLTEIEKTMADKEANMLSTDLRQEYERQLQNIRTLRGLYEERARLAEITRQGLQRELEEQRTLNLIESNKSKELTERVQELEDQVRSLEDSLEEKRDQASSLQHENEDLKAQMLVVNKLFSQVLLGYKTEQDLDTLVHRLEENHGLLTQMAERDENSEASTALPKLLLQMVGQMADSSDDTVSDTDPGDTEKPQPSTAEKIVTNLPKVWRVLLELLSHQDIDNSVVDDQQSTCYNTVETKSGPVLVPSVSKTYLRLQDLIIEKLALIKEVNKMKQLNAHLESRLEEQERRLCLVTTELSKTWHVVGRLRRHHHQLHTHEKILKYELQQKRKLLNELKEELEYCREKWDQAREKNSQSERDWKELRAEFSNRKLNPLAALNHSAESGYSDDRPSEDSSDSNDESEAEPQRRRVKRRPSLEVMNSSTDVNVAEREDPVSDLIDVADLPLDSHEESHCDKGCVETEDEACEIVNECNEDVADERPPTSQEKETTEQNAGITTTNQNTGSTSETSVQEFPCIDPAAILKSIKEQNARLELKDRKLDKMERDSAVLLKQTQNTMKLSESLNQALNVIINRPSTSQITANTVTITNTELKSTNNENVVETDCQQDSEGIERSQTINDKSKPIDNDLIIDTTEINNAQSSSNTLNDITETTAMKIDPAAILENIKKQNERLARKDERLNNLESSCGKVIKALSKTLQSGEEMEEKLDSLHEESVNRCTNDIVPEPEPSCSDEASASTGDLLKDLGESSGIEGLAANKHETSKDNSPTRKDRENSADDSEPSTSSEMDHEARFAARDRRLTRLEEQTRSLVKKMNKTTSKGVKINYKLEELHNIYGSENSRAGTPFDDKDSTDNSRNDSE